ncbi:MAG: hypothetical protein K0Q55_881 [Verrucomicrobia bacterium]|jgi:hypothetical protein|nr:hypothetical protein [Verrucomicrobiota bacterium]
MTDRRLNVLFRLSIVQILLACYFIVSSLVVIGVQERQVEKADKAIKDFSSQATRASDYTPLGWFTPVRYDAQRTAHSGWHMLIAGFALLFVTIGELYVLFDLSRTQSAPINPTPPADSVTLSGANPTTGPPASHQNPALMAFYLAALPLLSTFIFILDTRTPFDVLGWSKNPGPMLMLSLLGLAILTAFWRVPLVKIILVTLFFLLPICLPQICGLVLRWIDIFQVPNPLWYLLVFLPLLLGGLSVYHLNLPRLAKVGYLFVGAYIGAVHIYNGFYTEQHMNFFGGGWTA